MTTLVFSLYLISCSSSGGALVNRSRIAEVSGKFSGGQKSRVGIFGACQPVLNVIHPVVTTGDGFDSPMVVDVGVQVVVGVLDPGESELLDIVQAVNSLSLGFCLAERGEEHARQDGDDGDDHQELD